MRPDDLDRILSTDDDIIPASGFTSSVMELVRRAASAPPPIPFPWVRLASGVVVMLGLAAWLVVSGLAEPLGAGVLSLSEVAWSTALTWTADAAVRTGAAWTTGALLLALVSSMFSLRLASPRT